MKMKTSAHTWSAGGAGGLKWRRSFEGPSSFQALGEEEQGNDNEQNAKEIAAPRGQSRLPKQALYNVGDHRAGSAADERGARKSPERENEAKVAPASSPGMERGRMTRRNVGPARAEVMRSFDKRAWYVLEGRVDRQNTKACRCVSAQEPRRKGCREGTPRVHE